MDALGRHRVSTTDGLVNKDHDAATMGTLVKASSWGDHG